MNICVGVGERGYNGFLKYKTKSSNHNESDENI